MLGGYPGETYEAILPWSRTILSSPWMRRESDGPGRRLFGPRAGVRSYIPGHRGRVLGESKGSGTDTAISVRQLRHRSSDGLEPPHEREGPECRSEAKTTR